MANSIIDPEPPQPSDPTEPPEKANYNDRLHEAVCDNDVERVKSCLAKGADIETKSGRWKATPLQFAVKYEHENVVRILLEKNASVDSRDCDWVTPLHLAVRNETIVKILLEHHADINVKDNSGMTHLHAAAVAGNETIAKILLEQGALVNAKKNDGKTPLLPLSSKTTTILSNSYYAMVLNLELKTKMGILN